MTDWSTIFLTEILGTSLLIILGNGIMANILLKDTKGNNAGPLAACIGWGLALTISITISLALGGIGHLNPAVTFAFIAFGWEKVAPNASWGLLPIILLAQLIGAIIGQIIVDLFYFKHITHTAKTDESNLILAMHTTVPQNNSIISSFSAEFVATFIFVMLIFAATVYNNGAFTKGAEFFRPMLVGLTGIAIGLSLGGQTGAGINPFRDLGPRIVYQLLPIKNKVSCQWVSYAWIPLVAPLLAGLLVGSIFILF